jgi:protein-disulfide isomerase
VPADPTAVRSKRAAARRRIEEKRAAEVAARARAQRRRRTVLGGTAAAIAVLAALVVVVLVQTQRTSTSAQAAVPGHTVDGTIIAVGSADAPVTVDLYEDFQCPNCRAFEDAGGKTLAQLVSDGTVQARYHGMAFLDTSANHDYSTRALNAAAVVVDSAGPEGFQTFHDLLYAHQPAEGGSGLTDEQLVAYAVQSGADAGAAAAAGIEQRTYGDWVKQATDRASKDGVTGTPTVVVDGKKLTDLTANGLSAAVAAARAG